MELWGGRFRESSDQRLADFTRSIELDSALADDDLVGSIAHVHGLARAGLLSADEATTIVAGLQGLRTEVAAGTLAWDPALEDVHLNLEAALAARIGPLAAKLHTGRSRNDQVATDLRLWARPGRGRAGRGDRGDGTCPGWPGRARGRRDPAGHDPHPAGPADPLRPPPAGLCRDARARPGPAGRRPPPTECLAPRVGCAGRGRLPPRPGRDGQRAGLRRAQRELASTPSATAISSSRSWPRSPLGWSI